MSHLESVDEGCDVQQFAESPSLMEERYLIQTVAARQSFLRKGQASQL